MAAAIRDAGRPLAASEVAERLSLDASNASAALKGLAKRRLLDQLPGPPRPPKHRGNWPTYCYALTDKGAEALESTDAESQADTHETSPGEPDQVEGSGGRALRVTDSGVGLLQNGAQLVLTDATHAALPELFHVLKDADPLAAAAWAGLLDGPEQTYLVAFIGDRAATDAMDLLALLSGARIDARRVTVAQISEMSEFSTDLSRRAVAAMQARLARDTREAGQG